jgi:hypothetical protein
MKDKNGKTIHKGDIIEWKIDGFETSGGYPSPNISWMAYPETRKVVIEDVKHLPTFKEYTGIGMIERQSTIEIIGNKFKNPELLEAK